jgi:hypothetical protein
VQQHSQRLQGLSDIKNRLCRVSGQRVITLKDVHHAYGENVVANGWLFRDQMEVMLWRQSNRLVEGEKLWEAAKRRDPAFTCANMFWWYNMASSHDFGATPRPIYKADGRKLPDCYTVPDSLRDRLTERPRTLSVVSILGARDHDSINALDCGCDQDSDGRE